jgi:hypothetical protein
VLAVARYTGTLRVLYPAWGTENGVLCSREGCDLVIARSWVIILIPKIFFRTFARPRFDNLRRPRRLVVLLQGPVLCSCCSSAAWQFESLYKRYVFTNIRGPLSTYFAFWIARSTSARTDFLRFSFPASDPFHPRFAVCALVCVPSA